VKNLTQDFKSSSILDLRRAMCWKACLFYYLYQTVS